MSGQAQQIFFFGAAAGGGVAPRIAAGGTETEAVSGDELIMKSWMRS